MDQKRIEKQALVVGIVVNIVMVIAGFVVFFITGLKAMFLDAAFTFISVVSGAVAALLSSQSVRTSDRYPNGKFALEPIYAICKALFTLTLLVYSFLDVLQVAIDYFVRHVGAPAEFGPVVIYQIAAVAVCLVLVGYYRHRNRQIGNVSTMLRAEANGTWIDGMISLGIGIIAVIVWLLPADSPLDFLRYTGDFFITTIIVLLTIKEPILVLRDAFVELVGGVHQDEEMERFVEQIVAKYMPSGIGFSSIHIFKTGMNFDVDITLVPQGNSILIEDLVQARDHMEHEMRKRMHLVHVDFVFA
ncbi:cation transporter [Bifidobacterium gallicum]|uniref:Cation diffusion facilitator family transporter n=1 Tax=Bifidobacterium gallicum DSM 20093 = LMG 11596 TaxID=561180 RepID=D1NUE9_9BIFI|nr:cation transporter [Bifidobacterium gallicum]EFA23353.1 cation diffusion facilitator family transporter [Bifidobacterium gallicum DSM 20093 = LMG 11596]KFI57888.1 cobalt transporter [Bifidobacterium gallicum DSM 20093 = LMG 11596]